MRDVPRSLETRDNTSGTGEESRVLDEVNEYVQGHKLVDIR